MCCTVSSCTGMPQGHPSSVARPLHPMLHIVESGIKITRVPDMIPIAQRSLLKARLTLRSGIAHVTCPTCAGCSMMPAQLPPGWSVCQKRAISSFLIDKPACSVQCVHKAECLTIQSARYHRCEIVTILRTRMSTPANIACCLTLVSTCAGHHGHLGTAYDAVTQH